MTQHEVIIQIRDAIVSGNYNDAIKALDEYVKQEIEKSTNNGKDDITCIVCGKKTKIWCAIDTWTIAYGENYCFNCSKK